MNVGDHATPRRQVIERYADETVDDRREEE